MTMINLVLPWWEFVVRAAIVCTFLIVIPTPIPISWRVRFNSRRRWLANRLVASSLAPSFRHKKTKTQRLGYLSSPGVWYAAV